MVSRLAIELLSHPKKLQLTAILFSNPRDSNVSEVRVSKVI